MLQQKYTRRIVTAAAALCVATATLTFGPTLVAQQAGGEKMKAGTDKKLTTEQTDTLMAEMKDMQQSLSSEAERKALEEELVAVMCQMQMAEELMKDPQFKKAMKDAMASPEGQKMEQEMKQMMENHEQVHEDLLADPDVVRGTVIMAKAKAISKEMEKQSKEMRKSNKEDGAEIIILEDDDAGEAIEEAME